MAEEATSAPHAEVLRMRDLIGWDVADASGDRVGQVTDLLVGRDGQVRYLAVKLGGTLGIGGHSVLVPADALEWGSGSMVLPRWSAAEVRALPTYDASAPLTAGVLGEMERSFPRHYGSALDAPATVTRIVPLREAKDFKLSKGAPDLRGWNVFGNDNERVGTVHEMLVDPDAMKIRYLDVDVADDLFLLSDDRHVLVPAEAVELRERGQDVWVGGMTARELATLLPAYTGGPVDPVVEERVAKAFEGRGSVAPAPPPEAYDEPPPPIVDSSSADVPPEEPGREGPPPPPLP